MEELQKRLGELQRAVRAAVAKLRLDEVEKQLSDLQAQTQAADFWVDNTNAQAVMKHQF